MGSLHDHIEQLGKACGYKNMTVLCKSAGVPRTTMSELNAGRSKDLSKPNAQKFASLLNLSLDEIYGSEQEKAPTLSDEREIGFDDFTYAFNGEVGELTDSDKQLLLSMARQLNEARKQKDGKKTD